jgi:N-acetylglutamate synthase-like GNAT family acetyltransferase
MAASVGGLGVIRRAVQGDAVAIEQFLKAHAATSMFLRGNLASHGTCEESHPHGTTFFLNEQSGSIRAVAGITNAGQLMCQAPTAPQQFFDDVAAALHNRSTIGMTGEPSQVTSLLTALGCNEASFSLRDKDPLYELALTSLKPPLLTDANLRPPALSDATMLANWFVGYYADTGMPLRGLPDVLAGQFIAHPDARLLEVDGDVVAMSALNARAPDMVQIGGVYVPPHRRGAGYGGEIVAQHLLSLRGQGIEAAILFAATPFAARAYEAIGFRHIGAYEVALLKQPWRIGA